MSRSEDERFMREAIGLAEASVEAGGGPFGAVVVLEGRVVGRGSNRVTLDNDPSAHAEIVAIRDACRQLECFSLEGCRLYVNCEPCPMCLAAAYWARLDGVHYAATAADAAGAGFDDELIAEEVKRPLVERRLPMAQLLREEALAAFERWRVLPDRVEY